MTGARREALVGTGSGQSRPGWPEGNARECRRPGELQAGAVASSASGVGHVPGVRGRALARGIAGFRSIDLVRRERDHDAEFMTLMWFDTLGSVKEFMGDDYETAHVPAQARAVLTDFDRRSAHYEVLDRREQPG